MKVWLSLLLLLGLIGSMSPARAQQAPAGPEAELHAALDRFFRAYSRQDMTAALAEVTDRPAEREIVREYLQEQFDTGSDYRFTIEKFAVRDADELLAISRARVSWQWTPKGKTEREEGTQNWDLAWIRELGDWKLRGFRFAERTLLTAFREAGDQEQRATLLKQDSEIVGGWLALSLRTLGDELAKQGKLDEAERVSTIAFEVAEWMNDDYERAYCHLSRGTVRQRAKRWNPALEDWDAALELFEKSKNHQGMGKAWRDIARVFQHVGEFGNAVSSYEKSIQCWRDAKNEGAVAEVLQDLGTVHIDAGRPADAEKCTLEALEIQTRLGNRNDEAQLLANLAAIRQDQERYAEALELYGRASRIYTETGDPSGEAVFLTNLGNLYDVLGQPEMAEQYHRRAVRAHGDDPKRDRLMIALGNLCNFLTRQGRTVEAIDAGLAALKISSETGDARYDAQALNTLGDLYYREREWERAISCYLDALDASRKTGNRIQEGIAVVGLAATHARIGKPGPALHYFSQAQTLAEATGDQHLLLTGARHQAAFYRDNGDLPRAVQFYRRAIEYVEQIRAQAGARSLQTSYLRQFSFLYHDLAECLVRLNDPYGAFSLSEQLRGRTLVDVMRSGAYRVTKSMTADEQKQEARLEANLSTLTRTLEKTVRTDDAERLQVQQAEARSELQKFQDLLYARHPQLRTRRAAFEPATPEELSRRILGRAPRAAILSYFPLPKRTLLFVLRRDATGRARLVMHSLPLEGDGLIARASEFWLACSTPDAAYKAQAQALFKDLVRPALPDLVGINHLVVIAGSDLGTLPFSALQDEHGNPLITRYALSYAPSVTALMYQTEVAPVPPAKAAPLPLLAFGNPLFPSNLSELPATEGEVSEIAHLFGPKAKAFIRKEALESRAKELLGRARIVHFATHGMLDARAPLYSSLVLTRDDLEDGFLQARELSELDLHADLVVLSACETALGQKVLGEGVVGLAWALFVGGARSTLASQWQVPDESTRTLMVQFYRRLLRPGTDRAEAMRQAQLVLLRDKRYAHPYHWAPFALSGQWVSPPPARSATRVSHN